MPCDLFGEEFPPPCVQDSYNFMYEYDFSDKDKKSDPFCLALAKFQNLYGRLPNLDLARKIKTLYEKHILSQMPAQERPKKVWTERSIQSWLEATAGADGFRRRDLTIIRRKIELSVASDMARRNVATGAIENDASQDKNTREWMKLFYHVQSSSARRN